MKKNKLFKIVLFTVLVLPLFNCSIKKNMIDNTTVTKLEIKNFTGTWYEIARFPHRFEKNLSGVTATYTLLESGKIQVVNQGYKDSLEGPLKNITGKAKIPDPLQPGKLKVSFFWFFYSDYLVMELDEEKYQWAVIGSSSPNYLWILSRKPQMDEEFYKDLLNRVKLRGYDISKLQLVPQKNID